MAKQRSAAFQLANLPVNVQQSGMQRVLGSRIEEHLLASQKPRDLRQRVLWRDSA